MKKYIIANWKAHKNISEAQTWLTTFAHKDHNIFKNVEFVICPPYPFLALAKEVLQELPHVSIGAQDISKFGAGSYTGDIAAHSLDGLVEYVIIGHSERRKYHKETTNDILMKTEQAKSIDAMSIVCVRSEKDEIPQLAQLVAYEPLDAIGSGENATVEEVEAMRSKLSLKPQTMYLYGGSVDRTSIAGYMSSNSIDGVLVGGAALDPLHFYELGKITEEVRI